MGSTDPAHVDIHGPPPAGFTPPRWDEAGKEIKQEGPRPLPSGVGPRLPTWRNSPGGRG
jgi:hypothetical protein